MSDKVAQLINTSVEDCKSSLVYIADLDLLERL